MKAKKAAGPSLDLPCAASRRSPPDGPVLQSASPEHARSHHDLSKSPRAAFPGAHVRAPRQRPYQKGGLPSLVSGRRLGPVPGRAAYNTQNLAALTSKAAELGRGGGVHRVTYTYLMSTKNSLLIVSSPNPSYAFGLWTRRLLMNHRRDSSNWSASCTITTIKKKSCPETNCNKTNPFFRILEAKLQEMCSLIHVRI